MPPYQHIDDFDNIAQEMFNMLQPSIDRLQDQIICYLKSTDKNADYVEVKIALFCNNINSYIELCLDNIKKESVKLLKYYVEDITNMETTIYDDPLINSFTLRITDSKLDALYQKLLNKKQKNIYRITWDIDDITKLIDIPKDFNIPFTEID